MKRIVCFLLAMIAVFAMTISASAVDYGCNFSTVSKAVYLENLDTGAVVYEKSADEKMYPASTTKIMTYVVVADNVADFDGTMVTINQSVIDGLDPESTVMGLSDHIGEQYSIRELLYGMMLPSGNDAALVLADYIGQGDVQKFVDKMNDKAKELGCENTHFANPDGLHDEDHYTTARDLLKITNYALKLPNFKKISDTVSYTCEGDDSPLRTTNYLIDGNSEYYYTYAEGIKTGTTDQAGRCLVTTASADGQSYILILLGAPYKEGVHEEYFTFTDAAALFRWCLTSLELKTVTTVNTPICEEKVKYASGRSKVTLVPEKDIVTILPKELTPDSIVTEINIDGELEAPLKADQTVGTISYYYVDPKTNQKQLLETVNLLPAEDVEHSGFLATLEVAGEVFKSYWFLFVIGLIVLVMLVYIIASRVHRRRKRRNREVKRYRNL